MLLNLHNLEDWVPFSTLDYPGELSAVLFFKGCPYRCHYCHNPHLLDFNETKHQEIKPVSPQSLELQTKFLPKRKKLLDAVVLSGGEALFEKDIGALIINLKSQGYKIGLHTAGSYPSKLKEVIENIDWIGFDVKTLPHKYDKLTHSKGSWNKTLKTLELIQDSQIKYECRISTSPNELSMTELYELTELMIEMGVHNWAVQELQAMRTNASFSKYSIESKSKYMEDFNSKFDSLVWRTA